MFSYLNLVLGKKFLQLHFETLKKVFRCGQLGGVHTSADCLLTEKTFFYCLKSTAYYALCERAFRSYIVPGNTHCSGKFQNTAGLQFDWLGFSSFNT